MLQGGDPDGTGRGGESFFGGKIRDEFDERLVRTQHKSQLYIAIEKFIVCAHTAHIVDLYVSICVYQCKRGDAHSASTISGTRYVALLICYSNSA